MSDNRDQLLSPSPVGALIQSQPSGVEYIQYSLAHEAQYLSQMRDLISRDLSEPYSIYVYRYFLYQWAELCFMAVDTTEATVLSSLSSSSALATALPAVKSVESRSRSQAQAQAQPLSATEDSQLHLHSHTDPKIDTESSSSSLFPIQETKTTRQATPQADCATLSSSSSSSSKQKQDQTQTKSKNNLIGVIICKLEPHRSGPLRGYIAMLATQHTHRGKGIATTLVSKAIDLMTARGADEIALETEETNTAAMKLYERLGFLRSKKLHRYYLNGSSAFRLMLCLKPPLDYNHLNYSANYNYPVETSHHDDDDDDDSQSYEPYNPEPNPINPYVTGGNLM